MMNRSFPNFEFEQVLRSDAADILAAREKARIMHHGHDIRAAGGEVEIAFRKVLRRKLPASYYVGHGHIVDQHLRMSRQLDVVIADNSGTPILFQAEDGSEYFPYEGVYTIGEVKTSYRRSERYIHTFAEHLAEIHAQLDRKEPEPRFVMPNFHDVIPDSIYGNPLFSFMFFVDAGDFSAEDVIDLYQMHPPDTLPNIVCFLQRAFHNWESSSQR